MTEGARFLIYRLPLIFYMLLIFDLSSGPVTLEVAEDFPDYVLHGCEYLMLCFLVFWALHEGLKILRNRGGYWLPVLITVLYGASDELHQAFVPSRDSSLLDLSADAAGALAAIAILFVAVRTISFFHLRQAD